MTLTGGCRCGAVRYVLDVDATPPVYCCHCLDCQSWSGSAFAEQAVIRPGSITVTGPIVEADVANPNGSVGRQHVCGVCHSRVWSENPNRPGMALLRAGTLDTSDTLEPKAYIWTKRKQPWIVIADDVPSWPENAPLEEFIAALRR